MSLLRWGGDPCKMRFRALSMWISSPLWAGPDCGRGGKRGLGWCFGVGDFGWREGIVHHAVDEDEYFSLKLRCRLGCSDVVNDAGSSHLPCWPGWLVHGVIPA